MRGLPGFLGGALALLALHTLVAYDGPSSRLSQLIGGRGVFVKAAERFLDPTIPAIPDIAGDKPSSSTPTATPAVVTQPYPSPTTIA